MAFDAESAETLEPFDPDAAAASDGLFGLDTAPDAARVVVVPVPWQATTSYRRGTRGGPQALLHASYQVDLEDLDVGAVWRAGIAQVPADPRVAAWDQEVEADALAVIESGGGEPDAAARVNARGDDLNALVEATVSGILDEGRIPAVIGGDHSVPFGAIAAIAARHPGVGILHIDAHADLRAAYEGFTWSHASIFHNVMTRLPDVATLVQVGIRDVGASEVAFQKAQGARIVPFFDNAMARELARGTPWMHIVHRIVEALPPTVYISFDVDGLDPAFCPNTGTPVPGGLTFRDVVVLLEAVSEHRRIVGFDLNEIGDAEWDGNVAARLLYKLCGWAARSQGWRPPG
ncbi:MAG: agmatinase family protein [Pseudomonadota bacterium]|nr:agmatinase family protein [Pseudomonadota bacterium]